MGPPFGNSQFHMPPQATEQQSDHIYLSLALGMVVLDFTMNAMEDIGREGKSLEDVGACEEQDRRCPSVTTTELNLGFQNHSVQAEHPKSYFKVKFSP